MANISHYYPNFPIPRLRGSRVTPSPVYGLEQPLSSSCSFPQPVLSCHFFMPPPWSKLVVFSYECLVQTHPDLHRLFSFRPTYSMLELSLLQASTLLTCAVSLPEACFSSLPMCPKTSSSNPYIPGSHSISSRASHCSSRKVQVGGRGTTSWPFEGMRLRPWFVVSG